MRILGIDPGYATIGFGLITAERAQVHMVTYGAITTPAGLPLSRRLYQIGTDMEELIGKLKPDVISIEELFFNTNLTTGIAVAHARGVLLYTAEKCGIPLHEYTPSQVKMAVVGYGKAEKRQVMDMTRRLLKLKSVPRPDDAADALALALCHARSATSRFDMGSSRRSTITPDSDSWKIRSPHVIQPSSLVGPYMPDTTYTNDVMNVRSRPNSFCTLSNRSRSSFTL